MRCVDAVERNHYDEIKMIGVKSNGEIKTMHPRIITSYGLKYVPFERAKKAAIEWGREAMNHEEYVSTKVIIDGKVEYCKVRCV